MSTTSLKMSLNSCMSHGLFYVQIHKLRPWHEKNVRVANFLRNKRISGNTTPKLDWTLKDAESTPLQSGPKYMITSSPLRHPSLLVYIFSRTWASSPDTLIKKDSLLFSGPLKVFPLTVPHPPSLQEAKSHPKQYLLLCRTLVLHIGPLPCPSHLGLSWLTFLVSTWIIFTLLYAVK